jgi:hypothetical protein
MDKQDLIMRNPLRVLGETHSGILPQSGFGAVFARAGVGKTAFLVQLSLNSLLQGNNVLHISLEEPIKKVTVWYDEVFRRIADEYKENRLDAMWDEILRRRLIMTFRVEGFSVPKLSERLADLTEPGIFSPTTVLVDGLPFDESIRNVLSAMKTLAEQNGFHVWYTVRTHRHESLDANGMPVQLRGLEDLFDVIVGLQPDAEKVHIRGLKGSGSHHLVLDPATMLISGEPR